MPNEAAEEQELNQQTDENATEEQEIAPSPLDMSDDDFLTFELEEETNSEEKTEEGVAEEDEGDKTPEAEAEAEAESEDEANAEDDETGAVGESEGDTEQEQDTSETSEEDDAETKEETTDKKDGEVDYKAEYEKVLQPFTANGKEIQVDNVDDAITLMQMGANYNKKMQGLKPNLRYIKMLENNGLLDENKLSYLIDLDKKNPEAIKKLIKDSGIDTLDLDVENSDYQPTSTYNVDDNEVELDTVLSELRESPVFQDTLNVISNKWDEPSKKALVENPGIIRIINQHMESGIYKQISNVVERERMLGRLTGLSDIQAYKQVGDAINDNGGFKQPDTSQTTTQETKTADTTGDTKRKAKRKSASFTKSSSSKKSVEDNFNPLNLSDEEFAKLPASKYM